VSIFQKIQKGAEISKSQPTALVKSPQGHLPATHESKFCVSVNPSDDDELIVLPPKLGKGIHSENLW